MVTSNVDKAVRGIPLPPVEAMNLPCPSANGDGAQQLCVHELFERQAAATPNAVAVIFGDRELSYAELNSKANQLARYLRTLGVGPEVLVGICLERSVETVLAVLGI